jgi:mannose-1-phosphate guanylyltransferase/phosphomannomutase
MKAVILAGGQGTRLRPITENLPKPMVTVLGRPIMEHIVRHLGAHGFTDLLATLHYRPRTIRDHFGDGGDFAVNMRYTLERRPLGTAGSVRLGADFLGETFLVIAGDALTDFDLGAFHRFHTSRGAKVSLCLKRVPDPGEFGVAVVDEDGCVRRFLEKPGVSEVCSDTVNTGIYLIEPEILEEIPNDEPYDFAGDMFPRLLDRGVPIHAHIAEGYWSDIGTLEQLKQAHWDFLDSKVRLPFGGHLVRDRVWVGAGTRIAEDADLASPCWIGDNVRIRSGAKIGAYTVLCPDVEIDVRATINRCIVMNNSFIGESTDLRNCIVGNGCVLETRCEIADDAVIGARCHLGRQVVAMPGVLVWPDKEVDGNSVLRENLVWESLLRPSIFGSRGVSGLANLHITPEYAAALGKAFGSWTGRGSRVAVGRDAHPFSRLAKRAFISGLLAVGVNVDDLEEASLPETRFITGSGRRLQGGVHIRMSDDHVSVAVIELFDADGLPLVRGARRKVEAMFHRAEFPKVSVDSVGKLTYPGRVEERYAEHLEQHLDRAALRPWVEQAVHFCRESNLARILTEFLGSNRLPDIDERRGEGNGLPLAPYERIAEIARLNHKIALIVERGGEQLTLVDEVGATHRAQRTWELLAAAFIIGADPDAPVFLPPDHPKFLSDLADGRVRRVVITHKEPAAQLSQVRKAIGCGDAWIHLEHFYLGYGAVAAALRLLEFLGRERLTLHDFERQIPPSYRQFLILPCPWDHMGRIMRELGERPEARPGAVPEGVRLDLDGDWVFVLPSADAPQLEITVEAANAGRLAQLERDVNHLVRSLIP